MDGLDLSGFECWDQRPGGIQLCGLPLGVELSAQTRIGSNARQL